MQTRRLRDIASQAKDEEYCADANERNLAQTAKERGIDEGGKIGTHGTIPNIGRKERGGLFQKGHSLASACPSIILLKTGGCECKWLTGPEQPSRSGPTSQAASEVTEEKT